jgi:ABC-type glutathione transport system ATPase component
LADALVRLDDVSVTYRHGPPWARVEVPVLTRVRLAIDRGETLGLVGESGAGKTTISKLTLGLLQASSGRVTFDGILLPAKRRRLRGRMQAVLQHPAWSINPLLKIGTAIAEPLRIAGGASKRNRDIAVSSALEAVGLSAEFALRHSHELSGGQLQRAALARALITRPDFIVFDEAVSALDMSVQAQVLNLIRDLQREHGFSGLFVGHDLRAVRYVADRIAVIQSGRITEVTSAEDFYTAAKHPYSRALQDALL